MLIFKRVNNGLYRSGKCSQLSAVLIIFVLTTILYACGDQSVAPLEPAPEKSTKESGQTFATTPPTQEQKLTTKLLQEKGAIRLKTNEIYELIVDNSVVFEHLGTGEYYEAIYKKDGRRLLTNVDSGSLDDDTLHDAYIVKDDKLHTEFKGQAISSTIYKLDQRYLAAVDSDKGAVNYEIRDIVNAPFTVAVLKSQNAKILSSDEITQLFVGKKLLIKDLFTGDEYSGFYDENGTRTLNYINPLTAPGSDNEMTTSDPYKIHNNQIHSILDGNEIASTIFELDSHYYGALSVDDGAVNFEFIPQ